jgi:minor extracellular serine protease Vpr
MLRNVTAFVVAVRQPHNSRFARTLFAVAGIAVFAGSGTGLAQDTAVDRTTAFEAVSGELSTTFVPAVTRGNERIRVVVIMKGDSVARVRAQAAGHKLSLAESAAVEKTVAVQHAAIKPLLEAKGAQVLAQYAHALNGIKVEVARSRIPELAALPGVESVRPVGVYSIDNIRSVPFIGAPLVWQGVPGFRGEGIKIAIVDTGIDYTHANFGGPGTVAAWNAAFANNTAPADAALFGPGAPKVKGGTDLVGDSYDANPNNSTYQPIPHPDPNPLDCDGHGSHVAGTAAGFGVKNNATYPGPYNSALYADAASFQIGPGVAPKANLYAVRVFGCTGSTDVVIDAIDWAVQNGMDVISMSLGADWGDANSADAIAAQNAVLAGITVVAASGNAGPAPYITSTPASGTAAITAAAIDGTAAFPGASLALSGNPNPILVQDSNGASFANGTQYPIVVLRNSNGTVSLGCNPAEYDPTQGGANVVGKLVVTVRGTCARVFRAGAAQHFGAAAAAMIDTSASAYPPFEGPIPGGADNPIDGNIYEPVTIPFFGVLQKDTTALTGPTGGPAPATATATNTTIANPGFETVASFSSGGPRFGDSLFKPAVSAPGVSIFSTAVGTGTGGLFESGTSMSTPHISGVSALVRQAHPGWNALAQRAAITQTADPSQIVSYSARLAGNGLVQPLPATNTQAYVVGTANAPDPLSLGFVELTSGNYSTTQTLDIHNSGASAITFNVKTTPQAGSLIHTIGVSAPSITVPAGGDANLGVKFLLLSAAVPATHPLGTTSGFHDAAGTLSLTPSGASANGGATLHIPYYVVPRVRSNVQVSGAPPTLASPNATLSVTNPGGLISGTGDFYAWGLSSPPQGLDYADTRAVGVQSFASGANQFLVFAINTYPRVSNPAPFEWDIAIYLDGHPVNGNPDYYVIGANISSVVSSQPSGRLASFIYNPNTNSVVGSVFFADAATDNSTFLLPAIAQQLGLSATSPRFRYQVFAFSDNGGEQVGDTATYNAFAPAISTGQFATVAPNGTTNVGVSINATEWALSKPLGIMVVSQDNPSGAPQAVLIPTP